MSYQEMERAAIRPSPLNPRKHFDPAKLQALAGTMGNGVGIIEPLVVRVVPGKKAGEAPHYELVAGERRWRAAEIAGLDRVPVVVKELTDAQTLEIMVIENNQREDITPLEEAAGFQSLLKLQNTGLATDDKKRVDVDELARRLGRSRKYVYDRIKLLALIPGAQELLATGRITAGHAILLARLTPEEQKVAIDPHSGDEYGDEGLFRYDGSNDDEAPAAKKGKDPYRGLSVAPVRSFQSWIRNNCRLNLAAAEVQEEFPELAGAIEKAAAVVHITRDYDWETSGDVAEGEPKIYTVQFWKLADGREGSKKCAVAVTGVVVLGRDRGQAFPVCVDKACRVHWPPAQKAKSPSSRPGVSASASASQKRWKDQQAREQKKRDEWKVFAPAALAACAAKLSSVKPVTLFELALSDDGYLSHAKVKEATELLGAKKQDAETLLQVLAMASLIAEAGSYNAGASFAKLAKRVGVDVAAIVKKVQTSAKVAAAVKPAAVKAVAKNKGKAVAKSGKKKAA